MPLFRNTEPDLRALIAYIVARAQDRSITLTQTKLVKLLYLVDVARVSSRREPLTGLRWVFFHYGPYAFELEDTLDAMDGSEVITSRWRDSVLYRAAPDAPDGEDWLTGTRRTVDQVIDRFAALELNELLNHVYFHTGPMLGAQRGQELDMQRARGHTAPRRQPPLSPPPKPHDLHGRLARWRERNAQRLTPVSLDPPARFFDEAEEDLGGDGVTGRIDVIDESGL